MFDREPTASSNKLFRCAQIDVIFRAERGGMGGALPEEVQANMGMAALLMPRRPFRAAAEEHIRSITAGDRFLAHGHPDEWRVANALATHFQVSKQAASIRLQTLRLVLRPGEQRLI